MLTSTKSLLSKKPRAQLFVTNDMIFSEMYTSKSRYPYCTIGTNNQIKNSKPVVRFQANDVFKARHSYGRITNISLNKQTLQSLAKYTSLNFAMDTAL